MAKGKKKASVTGKGVPVKFVGQEAILKRYATNIMVQHTDNEFTISFFDAEQPVFSGSDEEKQAQLERIQFVPCICVGRIVVSPSKMAEFVEVINKNYDSYTKAIKK